jgi:predicted acylesterase/phospholipase RssA
VIVSACSGSVLFATLWACGLSSDEIARFWLELPTRDYVDPDWRALARGPLHRFRSTTGLLRGEAIERAFQRRIGTRTLGEAKIPLAAVVWNIDENRVEYLSTRRTPDLPIARVARIAISIPIMVEPVQIGNTWYGDGGIVDIFQTAPLADEEPIDLVIGTNCYLPETSAACHSATGTTSRGRSCARSTAALRRVSRAARARAPARRPTRATSPGRAR